MIEKKVISGFYGPTEVYVNQKTGQKYQRIAGGLGFPVGDRAGYVVVVAEDRPETQGEKSQFWIMAEHESFSPNELFKACVALGRRFHVMTWYGDTDNLPMMRFLTRLKFSIAIVSPPYLDDPNALNSYIATFRDLASVGNKRLHFLKSDLGSRLLTIPGDKIRRATKAQDFPIVMALGGCLNAMLTWPYNPQERAYADRLNESLAEDYD